MCYLSLFRPNQRSVSWIHSVRWVMIALLTARRPYSSCWRLIAISVLSLYQSRGYGGVNELGPSTFPQIDIIGAVVIVWRVRGKIIRYVLCNIVCNNCAQCDAHTITTPQSFYDPFFRDPPGWELVPEENFWCKERLTEADTPPIRLGATTSRLTSAHLHHPPDPEGRGKD